MCINFGVEAVAMLYVRSKFKINSYIYDVCLLFFNLKKWLSRKRSKICHQNPKMLSLEFRISSFIIQRMENELHVNQLSNENHMQWLSYMAESGIQGNFSQILNLAVDESV